MVNDMQMESIFLLVKLIISKQIYANVCQFAKSQTTQCALKSVAGVGGGGVCLI